MLNAYHTLFALTLAFSNSPWGNLSANVEIDMGGAAGAGSALFFFLRMAGGLIGSILVLTAIIGYIITQKAQEKAAYKDAVIKRLIVLFFIGAGIAILSLIMKFLNDIFGVY